MGRPKKDSAKSLNKLSKRSLLQVKKVALKKKALKLVKVALKDKKTAHKAIRKAITKFSELKTARKVEIAKKVLKKIVISKKKIGKVAEKAASAFAAKHKAVTLTKKAAKVKE